MPTKKELEQRIAELEDAQIQAEALLTVSRELNAARDAEELLGAILRPAIEAGASDAMLLYIDLDDKGKPEWVEVAATWSDKVTDPLVPVGTRLPLDNFPLCELWIDSPDKMLLISDAWVDERVDPNTRETLKGIERQGLLFIPLYQAGRWVGVTDVFWRESHEATKQEQNIYNALPTLASPAAESRRLVDTLEREVQIRTAELRESEGRMHTILASAPLIVFVTDEEGVLTLTEGMALDLMGVGPEDLIGVSLYDTYDGNPKATEALHTALKEGNPASYTSEAGNVVFDNRIEAIRDENGEIAGAIGVAVDITERKQSEEERLQLQQEVIEAQQTALRELSSPIIPVAEGIIVMPLIGSIDTSRARDITRALLKSISQFRAKVVILDITGVPMVDSGVAEHLNKTIQAARLKGARTIITGISDAVAETVVDLGINWGEIQTLRDLRTGLAVAIDDLAITLG